MSLLNMTTLPDIAFCPASKRILLGIAFGIGKLYCQDLVIVVHVSVALRRKDSGSHCLR